MARKLTSGQIEPLFLCLTVSDACFIQGLSNCHMICFNTTVTFSLLLRHSAEPAEEKKLKMFVVRWSSLAVEPCCVHMPLLVPYGVLLAWTLCCSGCPATDRDSWKQCVHGSSFGLTAAVFYQTKRVVGIFTNFHHSLEEHDHAFGILFFFNFLLHREIWDCHWIPFSSTYKYKGPSFCLKNSIFIAGKTLEWL